MQHLRSMVHTLRDLRRNAGATMTAASVIGVALALPAGLYVALENLNDAVTRWGTEPQASLFLTAETSRDDAEQIAGRFRGDSRFKTVRVIDRADALAEFKTSSGLGDSIDALTDNPLPHIVVLELTAETVGHEGEKRLLDELGRVPGVAETLLDLAWVERLAAITQIARRGVMLLAVLLGCAVTLIVGNTIRTGIYSRRDEIEVEKLCGATDAFVRRPFLYSGVVHGVGGAVLACAVVAFSVAIVRGPVERLAALYASAFQLHGLSWLECMATLGLGAALGWGGAWLAVALYLGEIDVTRD